MRRPRQLWSLAVLPLLFLAACGSESSIADASADDRPLVVATTSILGDVVQNLSGGQFEVVTIMPVGTDPHRFQPSAQDIAMIERSSAVIANGAFFEEGLLDALEAAVSRGAPVFEAVTVIDPLDASDASHDHGDDEHDDEHGDEDHDKHGDEDHDEHGDDEHGDDEHGDEDHDDEHGDEDHDEHGDDEHGDDEHGDEDHDDEHGDDEHGHGEGAIDPHFFTDPARMSVAVSAIADFLIANLDSIDAEKLAATTAEYRASLEALDEEVETTLNAVPEDRRVLVTNHQVFAYFASRYDFEVIGTVVPVGSSDDGVSGRRLADLAELLEEEGVSVVFADISSSDELAQTLADEVGDVAVVKLYTESLGEPGSPGATYVEMVRSNAQEIATALGN